MPELISTPCILCGSTEKEILFPATLPDKEKIIPNRDYTCTSIRHREYWQIVRCKKCSFVYADPRGSDSEIKSGYEESEDELYKKEEAGRYATFERVCNNIIQFKKKGKILDIGCSIGTFLDVCRKKGFVPHGLELSQWSVKYANSKKNLANVYNATLETQKYFPKSSFDVITMLDLIEHLVDPISELKRVHEYIKPDGIFVIGTMNIDSWFVRLLKGNWPWYMKMHIYYFSPKTIEKMLNMTGFKVIKVVKKYSHCISLRYANHKLKTYSPFLSNIVSVFLKLFKIEDAIIPIDFGDFMTVYAQKVENEKQ